MTDNSLRLVVSLDDETQTYKPAAHNLSVQQAVEHVEKLQADNITAAIVVQDSRHRAANFNKCKLCRNAADGFAERLNQAVAGQDPTEQELAPVAGDEGTDGE